MIYYFNWECWLLKIFSDIARYRVGKYPLFKVFNLKYFIDSENINDKRKALKYTTYMSTYVAIAVAKILAMLWFRWHFLMVMMKIVQTNKIEFLMTRGNRKIIVLLHSQLLFFLMLQSYSIQNTYCSQVTWDLD